MILQATRPSPPGAPRGSRRTVAIRAGLVLGWLEAGLGALCAGILALLLAVVLLSVGLRYGLGSAFLGSDELAIWLHVALIAIGAPLSIHGALAMRLDVFTRLLPAAGQRAALVLADSLVIVGGLVLVFGGGEIIAMLGGVSPTLGLPEWVRFAFLGLGGALTLLVVILKHLSEGRAWLLLAVLVIGAALYIGGSSLSLSADLPASLALGLIALVGLVVAAPLPFAFLAAAFLAIPFGSSMPEPAMVASVVSGMSKFLLLAIPFFLLAGGLLTASGVAGQLVRFAAALVGHKRAGLAQTTLLTSVLFSGASGSSVANAAFGASTFQPELVKRGYPPAQAGAIIAATSVLDNVIPPSIAFLILAAATNLSVGSLLVGGFVAGAVMAAALALAIHFTVRVRSSETRATPAERRNAAIAAIPAFGLGVIVVAGIRLGVVTTTEAAALAALYTLLIGLFGRLGAKSLYAAFRQAGVEASAIGLLIGTAAPFAFLLAVDDISGLVASLADRFGGSPVAVLLLGNLILLVVGLVLDIGAAILLFGPLLLPLAVAAGIDPIHFGVILVVNLMIGGLTPPVGMLVYVVSGVTKLPAGALFRAILPYLFALVAALALLCAGAILAIPSVR
ncbi:TRAP transporter large permease subunit [Kaistia defluvii]|uniref:TRAP transporter large permease subunit n=1 Tax=Kaistia defluvii TaxID=410841 RepID=UPI00224D944F|nr:TRAP transporter large permease subunit [Kaistia defluvii]MCX5519220.1 TRAP transporter large permease subunit [Kaistia defluvii]